MLRTAVPIALAIAAGGCGSTGGGEAQPAASAPAAKSSSTTVRIKDFKYSPATVTVKTGTRVSFVNDDTTNHTVTAADGSFDLGNLREHGGKKFKTFKKAGTFRYVCGYHPFMKGKVVVR